MQSSNPSGVMDDDFITGRFPRDFTLKDGTVLTITPMVASDWEALRDFLGIVPEAERQFLRDDISEPSIVDRWCANLDYQHILPLLAWDGATIVADASLHQDPGLWTAHVGKVRLLVRPEYRGRGIGTEMVRQLIEAAHEFNLQKVAAECAIEQAELIVLLRRLGFREVARLPDFVCDRNNRLHEMVLLVYNLR
jgi:RimJ/RimL family protein N-acetyltransferase